MIHDLIAALAQVDVPAPNPAVPGAALINTLLGYGRYLVLVVSVGAVFYGAGAWAWSRWGNAQMAGSGRSWVMGGVAGALLAGLAPALINELFTAASSN